MRGVILTVIGLALVAPSAPAQDMSGWAAKVFRDADGKIPTGHDFGTVPSADGPHIHQFAPGARFFFSESGRSKFFSTAQVVFDTSAYRDSTHAPRCSLW